MRWVIWRNFDLDQVQMGGETAVNEWRSCLPLLPLLMAGSHPPTLCSLSPKCTDVSWYFFNHSILRSTLFCPSRQLLQVHSILLPGNCDCLTCSPPNTLPTLYQISLLRQSPWTIAEIPSTWFWVLPLPPAPWNKRFLSPHKPSLLCLVLLGLACQTCMQMLSLHCSGSTRTHFCFTT